MANKKKPNKKSQDKTDRLDRFVDSSLEFWELSPAAASENPEKKEEVRAGSETDGQVTVEDVVDTVLGLSSTPPAKESDA